MTGLGRKLAVSAKQTKPGKHRFFYLKLKGNLTVSYRRGFQLEPAQHSPKKLAGGVIMIKQQSALPIAQKRQLN